MEFHIKSPEKATKLAFLLKNVSTLSDTLTLYFNMDGLHAQGMDSAHVCLFNLNLTTEWFSEYNPHDSTAMTVSLNMGIVSKVMNMKQPKQGIRGSITDDKFCVEFTSDEKDEVDRQYTFPLIDVDVDLMDIPPHDSDVDIVISGSKLHSIISQMSIFGDCVDISCTEDKFDIHVDGSEGSMRVGFDDMDMEEYSITEEITLKQEFAIRYLQILCGFNKLNTVVKLSLSKDRPIEFTYSMDNSVEHDTNMETPNVMKLYLAPKISDDDDDM